MGHVEWMRQHNVIRLNCRISFRVRDKTPDIIVSETMAVCLHNEPQVSIARHLQTQAPEALLVPQSVSVELCALNGSKEHVFMPADYVGEFPAPERDRPALGKIFELDAATILSWKNIDGDTLPAGRVKIPAPLPGKYKPHLMTNIVIYGKHRLQDYDCSLTTPRRLRGKFSGSEELQFHYQLGNNPELHFVEVFKTDTPPLANGYCQK